MEVTATEIVLDDWGGGEAIYRERRAGGEEEKLGHVERSSCNDPTAGTCRRLACLSPLCIASKLHSHLCLLSSSAVCLLFYIPIPGVHFNPVPSLFLQCQRSLAENNQLWKQSQSTLCPYSSVLVGVKEGIWRVGNQRGGTVEQTYRQTNVQKQEVLPWHFLCPVERQGQGQPSGNPYYELIL